MHFSENINHVLTQPEVAELLFDQLSDIVFFVKNTAGEYQVVNQTLVQRCNAKSKDDLIGKLPSAVLGKDLGRRYEEQDQLVIRQGQSLMKHLELHNYQSQEIGWCLTTKLPIYNKSQKCIGIIGVSQDLKLPDLSDSSLVGISSALSFAKKNLQENPTIGQMATIANMSPFQLDRRMKILFGITTGKWILQTKITKASQLLIDTDLSILETAFTSGYNDQSAFTRQFRKATGLTPTEFQKRNRTR